MCKTILQALGYAGNDITMCSVEGHMILWVRNENKFFELTTNETRDLSKEEELQLNRITSYNKYLSHLLSNEATNLGLESRRDPFALRTDRERFEMAIKNFQEALELDPQNITAQSNLINFLKQKLTGIDQKEIDTTWEFKENPSEKEKQLKIIREERQVISNQIKKCYRNLLLHLTKRNNDLIKEKTGGIPEINAKPHNEYDNYIAGKFFDYADFLYYRAEDYKGAIEAWQAALNKAGNNLNEIEIKLTEIYIAKAYFLAGDYKKFIDEAPGIPADFYSRDAARELEAMLLAARIMSGEIRITESNVGDFCEEYRNDLFLGPFISGEQRWNMPYMYAVEALKKWDGFNRMMSLIKKEKSSRPLKFNMQLPNRQLYDPRLYGALHRQLREGI